MAKRMFFFRRDWLGDRLRREAMETRPAFSAAIHDRIEKVINEKVIEGCLKGDGRPARRLAVEKAIEGCRQHTFSVADANQLQTFPSESPYRRAGRFAAVSRRIAFATAATAGVALLVLSIYLAPRQWRSPTTDSPNIGNSEPEYLAHEGIPDPTAAEAAAPQALNARLAAQETQLGLLVYNDARRAARVLLNRLPVDLQAIDD